MKRKRAADYRRFDIIVCPFCGSEYHPEDIIYSTLSELGLFGVLVECRKCHTVYCVQRTNGRKPDSDNSK